MRDYIYRRVTSPTIPGGPTPPRKQALNLRNVRVLIVKGFTEKLRKLTAFDMSSV